MVGREMAEDLLSFGTPVLVIGDPAQLPPIGDAGYFTSRRSDYTLTEIHRQALGSPVIELATTVRKRERLRRGHYGDSAVVYPNDLPIEDCLNYDQLIVGTTGHGSTSTAYSVPNSVMTISYRGPARN